jgi:hypothetical protein
MADRLNYKFKIGRTLISVSCMFISFVTSAQIVNDPTRPPMVFKESVTADAPVEMGPRLESIITFEGRKMAIISGKKIALGENYGGAKLVQISETSVTLKSGKSTQVLKLFPNVNKMPAKHTKDVAEKTEQSSGKNLGNKP